MTIETIDFEKLLEFIHKNVDNLDHNTYRKTTKVYLILLGLIGNYLEEKRSLKVKAFNVLFQCSDDFKKLYKSMVEIRRIVVSDKDYD